MIMFSSGRSEEHTSELQSLRHLVCRLLLEKRSRCAGAAWPPTAATRAGRRQCPGEPFFFFNDTATTEIYTLSLHDALPICRARTAGRFADNLYGKTAKCRPPFFSVPSRWRCGRGPAVDSDIGIAAHCWGRHGPRTGRWRSGGRAILVRAVRCGSVRAALALSPARAETLTATNRFGAC